MWKIPVFTCILIQLSTAGKTQAWNIGGNVIAGAGASQLLGITSPATKNLVFVNGEAVGVPIERGRITSAGLWGIGTTLPNSLFHLNAATGQTPFRVQINGTTKLYTNSNGGVYAGNSGTPPANGLHVLGNFRSGTGNFSNDILMHSADDMDVTLTQGGNFLAGEENATNIVWARNGFNARNAGNAATLFLNAAGGDIRINNDMLVINGAQKKVGVMTAVPLTDLHILHQSAGPEASGLRFEILGTNDDSWTFYTQNSDGKLSLYEAKLNLGSYVGNLRGLFDDASGIYTPLSDARMKKDVERADHVLEKVLRLAVKRYRFADDSTGARKSFGLLAQDVEQLFPEVVSHFTTDDGKDTYTMNYAAFGVLAIKAIQERQHLIDAQQEEINALKQVVVQLSTANANANK